MTSLRGSIRSGNSGGPVVDANGKVVATVFAATVSGPRGGFGIPAGIVQSEVSAGGGPVDTGPCAR
jgi:S1-C subfamily serine protease